MNLIDLPGGTANDNTGNDPAFGVSRPQICVGQTYGNIPTSGDPKSRLNGYWNASAFCAPWVIGDDGQAVDFGNAGVGILQGPLRYSLL